LPLARVRFNRSELAGSFGDIGTDLPLLMGMIAASGLDGASTFIVFGLMQVMTGLAYGLPMPVQPLKAMAVIVIAQKVAPAVLYGGGLAIGLMMLALAATGLLERIARFIPKPVVRGLQLGLGLTLCSLALRKYVPADGAAGYALAVGACAVLLALRENRRAPGALLVMGLGALYALIFGLDMGALRGGVGLAWPKLRHPALSDVGQGLLLLALPQLALSIGNSVIATRQTIEDLFPDRKVGVRRIGLTYSLMNLVSPFLSGVPTCHGAGGLAGHYNFGARTGGAVVIYGSFYLAAGLFFSGALAEVVKVFPMPVLGVVLLFEGLALMGFVRDVAPQRADFFTALLVAALAAGLPNGFLWGMLVGTAWHYLRSRITSDSRTP